MKTNLKNLTLEELKQFCTGEGMQPYRAQQIFRWLWKKGKADFLEITTLSKKNRVMLEQRAELPQLQKLEILTSRDRTVKFLFGLPDGETIESVYIPTKKRKTVCVSTQVGCPLNCSLCMTGRTDFVRNLLPWEIADQVRRVESIVGKRVTNVVLMGMGEPLLNYENVLKAVKILNSDMGMNIGARKITLSTAGIVPGIIKLSKDPFQIKLAVSLNATTDKKREILMPINRKYNLRKLFEVLEDYYRLKKKRITFEYVLIKGFNDSIKDAKELAAITEKVPCKINIIPFNPIGNKLLRRPDSKRIKSFVDFLYPIAQAVTLRESRGRDIDGACGQLRVRQRNSRIKVKG
ncbi:MAG: 23S rRNA (adenine(2503)-C(2))-methyltransferase RlmN [Candidatus Cloacimonadota bacterium]|nr:MAG: 23S rRNA (adenine(2503)-C(2))-methyltransferase RlmN [Candidatus Cloacimonadota bacterium]